MNRQYLLLVPAVLLAAWMAFYAWSHLGACREDADRAARHLAECRRYADKLKSTRDQPTPRSGQEGVEDIRTAAEKIAADAGIRELKSVDQRTERRVGDTAYTERPYAVRLLKVTPMQVARFAHELSVLKGLETTAINLQAFRRDSGQDFWNVDLEFAYLIYDPIERER